MKNKNIINKYYLIIIFITFASIGVLFLWERRANVKAGFVADTEEKKEIVEVITRSYKIEAKASRDFDLSQFPSVFINDPRGVPIGDDTVTFIRKVLKEKASNNPGYLDYKMAYYTSWEQGALRLEEAYRNAAKEGRTTLNQVERRSLADENGDVASPRRDDPIGEIYLNFFSIEVNGDIAKVLLDDGPTNCEMILVRINGIWYIASSNVKEVHV